MNDAVPPCESARQRAGGGVVGRDQRQVQQVVERDPLVGAQIGRRRGVDVAALDGDFAASGRGCPRGTPRAVITLVMLAIDRLSCAFSSQSTWPVSGLKMMAAAARMSGTSAPVASVL